MNYKLIMSISMFLPSAAYDIAVVTYKKPYTPSSRVPGEASTYASCSYIKPAQVVLSINGRAAKDFLSQDYVDSMRTCMKDPNVGLSHYYVKEIEVSVTTSLKAIPLRSFSLSLDGLMIESLHCKKSASIKYILKGLSGLNIDTINVAIRTR